MTTRHVISYADEILQGSAYHAPYAASYEGRRGLIGQLPILHDFGAIAALDRDGIVTSLNPTSNATLTLNGAAVTSGVATFATPRNVTIYATTDESAKTLTVTGTDAYNDTLVETITGPTGNGVTKIAQGKKAFKTVTSCVTSGDFGTIEVGFGNVIGLPYRADYASQVQILARGLGGNVGYSTLGARITVLGTPEDIYVASPIPGVVTKVHGISNANGAGATATITITNESNASYTISTLAFASTYTAGTLATGTITNRGVNTGDILKVSGDGGGTGAGVLDVAIYIEPAFFTAADATTATATTGDTRGTIDIGLGADATKRYALVMIPDRTVKENSFGISQYGG